MRDAVWTPYYQQRYLDDKPISDIDGKYNEAGIIRYALFLGKTKIPLDEPYEKLTDIITKNEWTESYNSLVIGSIDFDHKKLSINPEYVTVSQSQGVSISYHKINTKNIPPIWEPKYDKYEIS